MSCRQQRGPGRGGAGWLAGRVLGQQPPGDLVEPIGQPGAPRRWRAGVVMDLPVGQADRSAGGERRRSGKHLKQHTAQGVQVGLRAGRLAGCLFGGQVCGGAQHTQGPGRAVAAIGPGDAEVQDAELQGSQRSRWVVADGTAGCSSSPPSGVPLRQRPVSWSTPPANRSRQSYLSASRYASTLLIWAGDAGRNRRLCVLGHPAVSSRLDHGACTRARSSP